MKGIGYFQNLRNLLRIYLEEFLGEIFWEDFLGGYFWEDFYGRNFLGGFFGRNSTKSYLNIEGIDLLVKILVFVKILYLSLKERKEENLNL